MIVLPPILRQAIQSVLERFGYRLVQIPVKAAPPDQSGEGATRTASQWENRPDKEETSEEYWTRVNVTGHKRFMSVEESLDYFEWRNLLYSGYIESMPVAGHDGKTILDYGCGPGHDVIGFAHFSNAARLIAVDVSATSLAEARARVALHNHKVEFIRISENDTRLPLEDGSIDLIHSSGVLHHTPNPFAILKEFRRIVSSDGSAQIMIYNRDSIFAHLGVLYTKMIVNNEFPGLSFEEAFQRSTDGPDCPISRCYRPAEWIMLCNEAGFDAELCGVGISTWEMQLLALRFDAIMDLRLPPESRRFLYNLRFDDRGRPLNGNHIAGIDACFALRPR
jgi:ubiquinone/menaquinone biosynthesis C-methylase UbiE